MAEQPDLSWRTTLKRRLAIASGAFLVWSVAIEARLVYFQVVEYDELVAAAENQQSRRVPAPPKRGEILDRNGHVLAYSVDAATVYAVPTAISNPDETVAALCAALRECTAETRKDFLEKLTRRDAKGRRRSFAYMARRVTPEQARQVAALELDGISFMTESRRYYPNKDLAAHLLGYVGADNTGLGGLESRYETLVGGEAGKVLVQVDAKQRPFSRVEKPPTAGASLELTIDERLQHLAERELREGVQWSGAAGGSAIVMDPFSGEILALANYPTFNPNAFSESRDSDRRNRAVQDLYEPGSTFKLVTAGAALEEGLAQPSDLINTSPGVIRFGSRVIDEAKGHNYGTLTFEDVIVKSSNVGAIKIGLRLGAERLGTYVARFGFGKPSSPDFRGAENAGIVWNPSQLTDSAVASVAMGYQVGVTPLQMAAAASSVANGGELVEPRVVRAVIRDGVRAPVPRKVLRRTISSGAAAQLTAIMEGVVERGTAKVAQIDGYTIAGKTGTAAKIVNKVYSTSDYNVSFVGFVPSRDPVFTIIVVIDSPHKVSAYGGTVAAPVFQKIASAALRHYGVPPSLHRPPPVLISRHDEVHEQPTSGPAGPAIVTLAGGDSASTTVFPDLVGMNARDAVRVLVRLGISPRIHGAGEVVNQRPAAGMPLDAIAAATLWLERRPRIDASAAGDGPSRTIDPNGIARGRP